MSTRILAELEKHMNTVIDKNCEEDDWPNFYVHQQLAAQMAQAAYNVFKASVDGQEYAKSQIGD